MNISQIIQRIFGDELERAKKQDDMWGISWYAKLEESHLVIYIGTSRVRLPQHPDVWKCVLKVARKLAWCYHDRHMPPPYITQIFQFYYAARNVYICEHNLLQIGKYSNVDTITENYWMNKKLIKNTYFHINKFIVETRHPLSDRLYPFNSALKLNSCVRPTMMPKVY